VVKTATAMVDGATKTILTNAQGMTLYYFTPDTTTVSNCTGGCAGTWPPLLITGSGSPTSATQLPGSLTAVANAHGTQVQYNGHFLYTYDGDSAPGQTNGEGIAGKWHVATTDLT
jgi:predicted lipoprotein with Yx(FWY)xxD motif